MIVNFKHQGLEKFYTTGETIGIRPEHAKRLKLILARLAVACEPRDMALPGLRLHPLKGKLKGYWAVDVSRNWRVFFKLMNKKVYDVDYGDYH